ncbi:hypothetical protein PS723_03429 [Pseudomonas fluorescens]|uniref:Uncharacterized protein n=1 Tax=Pseudomonas fluorescens TaxID=294 RepID=A0A5E7DGU2_PSEFL|nr:hypothetical protein PS723_03429 [Pseudomonas fluorescens]
MRITKRSSHGPKVMKQVFKLAAVDHGMSGGSSS